MDLYAYHDALNRGFSEREATRIGEAAYEESMAMAIHISRPYEEPTDADHISWGVIRAISKRRARALRRRGVHVWWSRELNSFCRPGILKPVHQGVEA